MPSHRAPDFERLIASVSHALRARGVPYMLIGGQAVLLHGEPRLTQDIDVTLGIGPDEMSRVVDAAQEAGLNTLPEDSEEFATVPGRVDMPARVEELRQET